VKKDQDDPSHSFHYVFAPYASAYTTRLTKYTRRRRLQRGHHHPARTGSGEAVDAVGPVAVILEMDDLTGFATFHVAVRERVYSSVRLSSLYPSCVRSHHPESQYIDLVEDIIKKGMGIGGWVG
jgi:hypothetical protein